MGKSPVAWAAQDFQKLAWMILAESVTTLLTRHNVSRQPISRLAMPSKVGCSPKCLTSPSTVALKWMGRGMGTSEKGSLQSERYTTPMTGFFDTSRLS